MDRARAGMRGAVGGGEAVRTQSEDASGALLAIEVVPERGRV
jgi:hypothetical protein